MMFLPLALAAAFDCAHALELARPEETSGVAAVAAFDRLVEALPREAGDVVARARDVVGEDGDFSVSFEVVRAALAESCGSFGADAAAARERARAIVRDDPRFAGVRAGDDVIDRIKHKIWLWIISLLESEGMQRYAGSARTIYLGALALAVAWLVWRTLRALRRRDEETARATAADVVERARVRAYAALRADADALLARDDVRGAMLAGQRALLVRIGEIDPHAVTPARTHREILRSAPPRVADTVAPALAVFDASFYGRDANRADAERFLHHVDDAASALAGGAP